MTRLMLVGIPQEQLAEVRNPSVILAGVVDGQYTVTNMHVGLSFYESTFWEGNFALGRIVVERKDGTWICYVEDMEDFSVITDAVKARTGQAA